MSPLLAMVTVANDEALVNQSQVEQHEAETPATSDGQ